MPNDSHPVLRVKSHPLVRYGLALVATALAIGVRVLVGPILGENRPSVTLYASVVFAALYCGTGPAILATITGTLGIIYFVELPLHTFQIQSFSAAFGHLLFVLVSGGIIWMGNRRAAAMEKLKVVTHDLKRERDTFETRVQERTAALKGAEESLRAFSNRLLQLQDEERRRIARDLHDHTGQLLAALSMDIELLRTERESDSERARQLFNDMSTIVEVLLSQIRTMSHLLHPPLLDETGIRSALQWYVNGFSDRSGIECKVEMPTDLERLPREVETAVFRIVQEALTNVHKHSGSARAAVRLACGGGIAKVEIQDWGSGMSKASSGEAVKNVVGVGLAGMRERAYQLGGRFEVESGPRGTLVRAIIPYTLPANQSGSYIDDSETVAGEVPNTSI